MNVLRLVASLPDVSAVSSEPLSEYDDIQIEIKHRRWAVSRPKIGDRMLAVGLSLNSGLIRLGSPGDARLLPYGNPRKCPAESGKLWILPFEKAQAATLH